MGYHLCKKLSVGQLKTDPWYITVCTCTNAPFSIWLSPVNMGILWSRNQLNGYEAVLEMHSKQITSLSSYKLCIDHLFSDQIYNIGRIRVWFFVSQQVYHRLSKHEQQQCHETVCLWFAKFKQQCPDYAKELGDMKKTWDSNIHTTPTWFTLFTDTDMNTMNSVFVCVGCGQEFYIQAHLLHHT